jgi:hypothetical protein
MPRHLYEIILRLFGGVLLVEILLNLIAWIDITAGHKDVVALGKVVEI